ncbi:MAG: hypothetical protein ACLPN6_17980 [Streptosporangiaceae bacterium]|jgi:hypothetical protein
MFFVHSEAYQGHRLGLLWTDVRRASLAVHFVEDEVVLTGAAREVGDPLPGLGQLLGSVIAVDVLE